MPRLVRFGVSLKEELLEAFDAAVRKRKYPTRSKAIEDLIRADLLAVRTIEGKEEVAGTLTVVYNHHKRELVNRLLDLQHEYQPNIVSTQHIHLNHDHCLEVLVVKGKPSDISRLSDRIKAEKGVEHTSLTVIAHSLR